MKAILEKIPHAQDRTFALFEGHGACPFHYHPEIELALIVRGSGQRYVGDHVGRFAEGDLVLMGPDLPHMYIRDRKRAGHGYSMVVQFLPDCLGSGFFKRGELRAIGHLLERARVGLVFHGRTRDRIGPEMRRLFELDGADRFLAVLKIFETLARSREARALASPAFAPSLALYQGERINRVCELISRKFREPLTQAEAARTARMSGPSFSRFFRRATNKTFRAFLNEVRVGHAAQALLETDQTVAEICYESGFGNLSNFNRQFLRLRRVSPREYRRRRLKL